MQKPQNNGSKIIVFLSLLLSALTLNAGNNNAEKENIEPNAVSLFDQLQLSTIGLKAETFQKALAGYNELKKKNTEYLI